MDDDGGLVHVGEWMVLSPVPCASLIASWLCFEESPLPLGKSWASQHLLWVATSMSCCQGPRAMETSSDLQSRRASSFHPTMSCKYFLCVLGCGKSCKPVQLKPGFLGGFRVLGFFFFFFFCYFRATPMEYRGSQAWGPNGVTAAGLRHSHSNTGSKPRLRPTPQLMTMPDP